MFGTCRSLTYWIVLASLWFGLSPSSALAQADLTPETAPESKDMALFGEIPSVFGASKYQQKLTEAPSSVTIITAAEIKKYGYRTLAEIIQSVRGFFTTNDRNYSYVGVRGFARPGDYSTRVLLLIDGHRMNDPVNTSASIGTEFPLDIDLIERLEIIRGPSSSIYGSNAFLGVISVITKRGRDINGAEVSADVGSFETYKGRASYGKRFQSGLEALVSGSYYQSAGQDLYYKEFDSPSTNNGIARNCDDEQLYNFFLRSSYKDFSLAGVYQTREKGIPTGSFGTVFNDSRNRTFDDQAFLDLKYEHRFPNDLNLVARLFYDHYSYDGHYVYDISDDGFSPNLVLYKDFARGEASGTEVQLTKQLFEKHKFIVGAEYVNSLREDQGAYNVDPYYNYFDAVNDAWNWGIYLQDEYHILKNLILNAGVRYDYFSTFKETFNPRLALIFTPWRKTTLKLLYGQAFRAPSAYELYYGDYLTNKANPNLKPETVDTYELVWEQYLNNYLRMSIGGFYYNIQDLISLKEDPDDGLLVFKNDESVESKGLEAELEGKWPSGVESRISYTFQEAVDKHSGSWLTNSPKHLAKFNLIVPLFKDKFFLGTELRYMSPRKTLSGDRTDRFFTLNSTLFSRNILKRLEVSASIYNLFDVTYFDPGSEEHIQDKIMQDGRTFRVKLTYSF